ncbi:hypothetical protein F5Y06DRAFT_280699, partial [Hypoxylon sp. FL0890]
MAFFIICFDTIFGSLWGQRTDGWDDSHMRGTFLIWFWLRQFLLEPYRLVYQLVFDSLAFQKTISLARERLLGLIKSTLVVLTIQNDRPVYLGSRLDE